MAATAYLGAVTLVLGASKFLRGESHFNVISILGDPARVHCGEWQCYVVSFGWVVFGTLGLVTQVRLPPSAVHERVALLPSLCLVARLLRMDPLVQT
jgi:hypothetical protein